MGGSIASTIRSPSDSNDSRVGGKRKRDDLEPPAGRKEFHLHADAILTEDEEEKFPLHAAVKFGYRNNVEQELAKARNASAASSANNGDSNNDATSAIINAVDSKGRTATDLAALTGQLDIMAYLQEAGGVFKKRSAPRMTAIANNRSIDVGTYLRGV